MSKRIDWETQLGRRLRIRDLHAFFTVVDLGSMAKAAQHLGVSQPAISKVIADLEYALGVRLLDRRQTGVEPTIYGSALLKRGLVAFDELKQGIRDIESLADPTAGELKIGCPESVSAMILPEILQRFSERHPRVIVHVDDVPSPAIRSTGLRERKFDLILARVRVPIPADHLIDDLNVEYLFDDPVVIVAGMHTRWASRRKVGLAELVNEPWILAPPNSWNYQCVAEAHQAQGLAMPKVKFVTFSSHLKVHFLTHGPFLTAFPRSWVRSNTFKQLPIDLPLRPWPVGVLTLKNRTLSPVVERFIECTREVAKSIAIRSQARKPSAKPTS